MNSKTINTTQHNRFAPNILGTSSIHNLTKIYIISAYIPSATRITNKNIEFLNKFTISYCIVNHFNWQSAIFHINEQSILKKCIQFVKNTFFLFFTRWSAAKHTATLCVKNDKKNYSLACVDKKWRNLTLH